MAAGGMRVTQGTTETADDVHVRVSRNETIVSAAHSRILAPAFAAVGVPGYGGGGLIGKLGELLPGFSIGGLVHGVVSGAGRALSDVEGAVANAARDAAHLAGSVYSDVVNGVVHVAGLAVDAGQMAADLAVSEFHSLESGFGQLGGLEAAGATGWVKDVTKGVTKEIAGASVSHLKGFAGVAAKVLDEGGWLMPGQLGYNGTARPELFLPGYQLGGLVGAGLPDLSTMSISAGGQTWTLAGLAQQMQTAAKDNSAMTAQLQRIGALLQQNPQAVADAIAQALNGVARLASSGAFYTTR